MFCRGLVGHLEKLARVVPKTRHSGFDKIGVCRMTQQNSVAKARPSWGKFAAIFLPSSHYLIPIFGLKISSQNHSFRRSRIVPVQISRIFTSTRGEDCSRTVRSTFH